MVDLVELNAAILLAGKPGTVVKAADAGKLVDADSVLAAAKAEAAALVAQATEEAAAIRSAARLEGLAEATEQLQDQLLEIAERSVTMLERTEHRILELSLDVARRIVEGLDPDEVTLRMAARAIKAGARSSVVRLRVAPEAVATVTARIEAMLPASAVRAPVDVIACPRVSHPGAVLETDTGVVDATVDSQITAIRRALARRLGRPEGEAGT